MDSSLRWLKPWALVGLMLASAAGLASCQGNWADFANGTTVRTGSDSNVSGSGGGSGTATPGDGLKIEDFEKPATRGLFSSFLWSDDQLEAADGLGIDIDPNSELGAQLFGNFDVNPFSVQAKTRSLWSAFRSDLGKAREVNVSTYPYSAAGRLFFQTDTGETSACSAQFVGDPRVLLTAAHCVRNDKTGKWFSNFRFYQGYRRGQGTPLDWSCIAVYDGWTQNDGLERFRYDYAFIRMAEPSTGPVLNLADPVEASNDSLNWSSIGYPTNFDNGESMHGVVGGSGERRLGLVKMVGNPFSKGASGGAWIMAVDKQGGPNRNKVIGVNSFRYSALPDVMFGPQFDENMLALYEHVRDGKCEG